MKTKRGQKTCSSCNTINGVRSFECKQCGAQFKMKKLKRGLKRILIKDHTILQKGDTIRVIGGSGPYYEDATGERTYFVERGKYSVDKVDANGIFAFSEGGFDYLYMGEICRSKILESIIKAPCKVLLLRKASYAN